MPVKLGSTLLKDRGENKQCLKPPPTWILLVCFLIGLQAPNQSPTQKKNKIVTFQRFPHGFLILSVGGHESASLKKMDGRVGISSAPFCVGFKTICYILLQWLVNRDAYNIVL